MLTQLNRSEENKSRAIANQNTQTKSRGSSNPQFVDNRPEAVAQMKMQQMANNGPQTMQLQANQEMLDPKMLEEEQSRENIEPFQLQEDPNADGTPPLNGGAPNNTGLPDNLKAGIENLSGYSMDDVKVHYNSDKPEQLQAHAYAQGTDIHLAPGQEKYLGHEAWHVVQQKEGRVKPTMQMKGKMNVNDDSSLETEADLMGAKAIDNTENGSSVALKNKRLSTNVYQRQILIAGEAADKYELIPFLMEQTSGRIHNWLTSDGMTATMKRNSDAKDMKKEITATESNSKAKKYLDAYLQDHIMRLLTKYDTEEFSFEDRGQVIAQVLQDVKLQILRLDSIIGTPENAGQFSKNG